MATAEIVVTPVAGEIGTIDEVVEGVAIVETVAEVVETVAEVVVSRVREGGVVIAMDAPNVRK